MAAFILACQVKIVERITIVRDATLYFTAIFYDEKNISVMLLFYIYQFDVYTSLFYAYSGNDVAF